MGRLEVPEVRKKPSEYFRANCFLAVEADETPVKQYVELFGDENLVFSTDYPRADSKCPHAVEAFFRQPLSEALQRNILWDNWARLYGVGERRAGRALLLRLCLVEVGDEVLDALEVAAMCLPNLLFVGGFEQHDLVVEFGRSSLDLQCKAALHSHLTLGVVKVLEPEDTVSSAIELDQEDHRFVKSMRSSRAALQAAVLQFPNLHMVDELREGVEVTPLLRRAPPYLRSLSISSDITSHNCAHRSWSLVRTWISTGLPCTSAMTCTAR